MQGIITWKDKVKARRAHGEDGAPWWDDTRSAWFNRFAGKSGRSATFRFMAPYVKGQVLEIGPGPGAYTRLLAPAADHIVAVEPSPHMARLLRENLGPCPNLEIVESTIEDYLGRLGHYDFALAANVLEGIEPIDQVIGKIMACTRVLAIGTWANAVTPAWSKAVQHELLGQQPQPDAPCNQDLLAVLADLGLAYQVNIPAGAVHGFANRQELVSWVEGFFGLEPGRRAELAQVLAPFIIEQDGRAILPRGQESWIVNVCQPDDVIA